MNAKQFRSFKVQKQHNIIEAKYYFLITTNELTLNKMKYLIFLMILKFSIGYNPDEVLDVPQIIAYHGYKVESHIVRTDDGYLLTLHRIVQSKNGTKGRQVVYLQHGLLGSSGEWLIAGNKSLPYQLSDSGYDVWLGNFRGNYYSRAHINLSPDSQKFWNFSWHEMALYDLPATVDYILNTTTYSKEIYYIGFSMGTTAFFVYASELPESAKNIKLMVALAPVVYMSNIKSPIKKVAPYTNLIRFISDKVGFYELLPHSKITKILESSCEMYMGRQECIQLLYVLNNFDEAEFDESLLHAFLHNQVEGTSVKTGIHYLQLIRNRGSFRCFDYGEEGNTIQYGRKTPPAYNIQNVKVPTYLMYGEGDYMTDPTDVKKLAKDLPKNIGLYQVPLASFNHFDFLLAKHITELVNAPLLDILQKYGNK